jgi:formylglycine-generating enzyme required for sulfatase activity
MFLCRGRSKIPVSERQSPAYFWAGPFVLLSLLALCSVPVLSAQPLSPYMVRAPGGAFWMGSMEGAYVANERAHQVSVKQFYISETEITQEIWTSVMGSNPSLFPGEDRPVDNVSWFDAVQFCNALSEWERLTPAYTIAGDRVSWDPEANGYRLPTEAEWEYAARGGASAAVSEPLTRVYYSGGENADEIGWYDKNSGRASKPVKGKAPNALGLYDMSGNVWEWVWDRYASYPSNPMAEPEGRVTRVLRGGAWFTPVNLLRVTYRFWNAPGFKANTVGFRIARNGP